MESLKTFDDFKLDDLDENWTNSVWDGEFLVYNEPPDEYLMFLESEDMRIVLRNSCNALKSWLDEDTGQNNAEHRTLEISWNTLTILDIKVRALLPVLGYIMKSGQRKAADEDSRQSCLYATSLYFILLAVPGSIAFNIFHPNLYQRAIETMEMSKHLVLLTKKRNKATNVDSFNITDESGSDTSLTPSEKEILIKSLNCMLCNFVIMTKTFWFKDHVQSLDITINGLLELTKLENDSIECSFQGQRGASISQTAYMALRQLCDSKHGPINITIIFIAKYVLPRLLCSHVDGQIKFVTNIREATIRFLKTLLDTHEKDAKSVMVILIQHLIVKCPERLEARQKQVGVLIKLLAVCTQSIILEAFKNIILLSHHTKIPCRIFAQEIIGKFLIESFLMECNLSDSLKMKAKKRFFAIALSRCMDCSSMVRGKAMATVAEFTDSTDAVNETILKTMFKETDPNKQFSMFDDLNEVITEENDLLPGSNVLIAMLTDRLEDERALVRRSAMQIFKNLSFLFPRLINDVTPIISRRCRDPTLTVRRFAVQVLSQLLHQFPDNSQLLEEWVETVIPQIFDTEVKVQEKVLEYLHELLLNRIKDVSTYTDNATDNLPWKILHTLTSMKMRKHLSKACSLWVKNGNITVSVVKNVQSHIGTKNNIAAWVFLVAFAENMQLPNIEKYIQNYKELLEKNDFHASLVLQILRYCWTTLDSTVLNSLNSYLHECLEQFKINFGLISVCLDIITSVIKYLHPNDSRNLIEENMSNLMKVSESEIKKIVESESQAAEAAPNYLKAMFTLGHATLFCTGKISPLTLRILEGILLEWNALPDVIKKIEELRASAVIILGQQGMRDREIAQEVIPIFGRLLREETDLNSTTQIAVKINSAKALADTCIRFTALVEPHLSDMCVSMKDASPLVREAIMVIFIQLLLEDFIKIKGPFFFHILTMLSDSDDMIRELTVFLIEERLLTKNKTLISQQFLESMYHYNNYQPKHKFYDRLMRDKEKKALSLPGKRNEDKRRTIYDFMLEHLEPPGKIKLLVKITSQILCGTCVDSIDVRKEEGACLLKDALYIINNDRLQPSSFNKHSDDEQQEHEECTVQANTPSTNAINVIVEGMKKHGLDVLLPTLIKLRKKLSILKCPLESDVKRLLLKTYSEYNKEQLSCLLSEYPKLEKDIEQFRGQVEGVGPEDENSNEEDGLSLQPEIAAKSNKLLSPDACRLVPLVVIRRLSVSQTSNEKNTSKTSNCPLLSTGSLESWNSVSSTTPNLQLNSPAQPGPSTSTPKSCRDSDSGFENNAGHISKARRLSAFFRDAEVTDYFEHYTPGRSLPPIRENGGTTSKR